MDQHVIHGQEVWPQISEHISQLYLFLEKKKTALSIMLHTYKKNIMKRLKEDEKAENTAF